MTKQYSSIRPGKNTAYYNNSSNVHTNTSTSSLRQTYWWSGSIYYATDITDGYEFLLHRSKSTIKDIPPIYIIRKKIPEMKKNWANLHDLQIVICRLPSFYLILIS